MLIIIRKLELNIKEKRLTTEITKSEAKCHKLVTVPVLELALKEFVLCYQHKTILSDAILIEKAKILASELGVSQGTLQFSKEWLQKFKERNALPLLQNKCAEYPPDRIYNMDETGLFYHNKIDTLVLENVEVCFLLSNTTSKLQPMDSGIIMSFKKHYRYHHIKWLLEQVEDGQFIQDLKMNVLQAIQYIIQGWSKVTANTIRNCWNHIKILSNTDDERMIDDEDNELMLDDKLILDDELNKAIKTLRLPNMMEVKEFLTISEENIVYEIPDDISEFTDMFINGPTNHPDEINDSAKIEIICVNKAL
ncbi:unnamed protein product [Rhizophagus irregularis]|nr:unnamed protein product [Rhizophagus irregularis]